MQNPDDVLTIEPELVLEIYKLAQQQAAALLILANKVQEPTFDQTYAAMREVALLFQQESERFLQEIA